jgi:hypothetical protein
MGGVESDAPVTASTLTRDRARLGGLTRAALYDGVEVTAKARQTFRDSFLTGHRCKVCPPVEIPADLALPERRRRADALHRAHYVRVRMARGKKTA